MKKFSFKEKFEVYWDNLIIGIIAGLVLYYGLKINNGFKAAIYIFIFSVILITIYTFMIWLEKRYDLDKRFLKLIKR